MTSQRRKFDSSALSYVDNNDFINHYQPTIIGNNIVTEREYENCKVAAKIKRSNQRKEVKKEQMTPKRVSILKRRREKEASSPRSHDGLAFEAKTTLNGRKRKATTKKPISDMRDVLENFATDSNRIFRAND